VKSLAFDMKALSATMSVMESEPSTMTEAYKMVSFPDSPHLPSSIFTPPSSILPLHSSIFHPPSTADARPNPAKPDDCTAASALRPQVLT